MYIQSLSVCVPGIKCINNCKFCVSRMHKEEYPNQLDENLPFYDLYLKEYKKRLEFVRDCGCNTLMLTGNVEPQQNKQFLKAFGEINSSLTRPFRWIEMQTSGTLLWDETAAGDTGNTTKGEQLLRFLRNHVGVSTISLSLSSLCDAENEGIVQPPDGKSIDISRLCKNIKRYGFNLRLSLNITCSFDRWVPSNVFREAANLGADQITIRKLYGNCGGYKANPELVGKYAEYVLENGKPLELLPFGHQKYSVYGMGTVVDTDCMATEPSRDIKYLILRPDCKLYSRWDDKGSLIF